MFWQDSSVFGVSDFLKAVENGEIEAKEQEARKKNPFEEFIDRFVDYLPWSLLGMLALFGGAFFLLLPPQSNTVIRPQPPSAIANKEVREEDATQKKDQ